MYAAISGEFPALIFIVAYICDWRDDVQRDVVVPPSYKDTRTYYSVQEQEAQSTECDIMTGSVSAGGWQTELTIRKMWPLFLSLSLCLCVFTIRLANIRTAGQQVCAIRTVQLV